jgi:hypothetical protein
MSKSKRKARQTLEVTIMFEPSRLATEHLADAYAQLVPLRRRKTARAAPQTGADPNEAAPMRRQPS